MNPRTTTIIVSTMVLLFEGCTMMSTLQSPKTQEPWEFSYGLGSAFVEDIRPSNHFAVKFGLVRRVDTEFRFDDNSYSMWARYQVTNTPYSTVGIGKAEVEVEPNGGYFKRERGQLWQLSYIIGEEHWLTGFKATYSGIEGPITNLAQPRIFERHRWTSVALLGGFMFSIEDVHFMVELNWHLFRRGKPLFVPAIGIMKTL